MQFSTDDLKPLLQYVLPIFGGLWFVIKLVFSQWKQVEEQKHQAVVKDQINLKEAMAELKATVATMAQVQSQAIKEFAALKEFVQDLRLEMKDDRIETVKSNEEIKGLFRTALPLMKRIMETQVREIAPEVFRVETVDKKKKP